MEVHMLVLTGLHKGESILLPPTQFVIGRDPECHLRPASADVSRFHCAITRLGQQILVRDLKSRNGTFLGTQRLTDTAKVQDGDILQIGPLRFQFEIHLGPGANRPSVGNLSWLLRDPNEKEEEALSPSKDTSLGDFLLPEHRPQPREADEKRSTTAVAGEFLREYLNRRMGLKDQAGKGESKDVDSRQ
jgi:pSer/pThr/pTyr-binding forkhead associated (FHA) protein